MYFSVKSFEKPIYIIIIIWYDMSKMLFIIIIIINNLMLNQIIIINRSEVMYMYTYIYNNTTHHIAHSVFVYSYLAN